MQTDGYNVYILVPFPFFKKMNFHATSGMAAAPACAGNPAASVQHAQSRARRNFVRGLWSEGLGREFEENVRQLWWEP